MRRRQFLALFICGLVVAAVGSTTLALLPVYMQQLGADEQLTGIYFSVDYLRTASRTMTDNPGDSHSSIGCLCALSQ